MGAQPKTQSSGAPPQTSGSSQKRKPGPGSSAIENGKESLPYSNETPLKKPKVNPVDGTPTEKRLRRFRPKAPQSFHEVYQRATTQRFYVLSRTRDDDPDSPSETVELTGSTGNIYTVVIAKQPTCNCPHAQAGNQCKHVLYVLSRVLGAKYEYVYQLALLTCELHEIFARAPPIEDGNEAAGGGDKNRKLIDGDCPICFSEMEAEGEAIVWCRAACGQNIHKECFEMWAATKRRQDAGAEVTCPYCRSVWEGDEDVAKKINRKGKMTEEGYVNVADQLGISGKRDISMYSRWWTGHPETYRRYGR
ncbi:hypothetical protein OQA88_4813 [Cercophora sp. LCS_1]